MSGQSAIGGYGGDGANGTFNNRSVALGGGKAGAFGNGTSTHSSQTQSAGNPGVGGFGRITGSDYNNFTIYTSGNSGTASEVGSNGKKTTNKRYSTDGPGYYAYFGALLSGYLNGGKTKDIDEFVQYGGRDLPARINRWSQNVKNDNSTSGKAYSSIGGVSGSGNGVSTYTKRIYMYSHAIVTEKMVWALVYWSFEYTTGNDWTYVGWTSGETVNSAGQITFVGGGNVTT